MRGARPQQMVTINGTVVAFPPAPAWLSHDAQAEWQRMQPFLEAKRYLTDVDLSNLENYCVAQGRVRECERDIVGVTDVDLKAKLWRMQKQAMDAARQLSGELGLSPLARARVAIRGQLSLMEEGDDPLNVS